MPVKNIFFIEDLLQVGVWKITEDLDLLLKNTRLSDEELFSFSSFSNERRKREWLAARCLLDKLKPDQIINYKPNGKPFFQNESCCISLSHTKGWVTVVLNSKYDVGCDIERITEKVLRIKSKFASDKEIELAEHHRNKVIYFTIIWSAKEAIYKMYSDVASLEFKSKMEITVPNNINLEGTLLAKVQILNATKKIRLNYHIEEEYVLVYTLNE